MEVGSKYGLPEQAQGDGNVNKYRNTTTCNGCTSPAVQVESQLWPGERLPGKNQRTQG